MSLVGDVCERNMLLHPLLQILANPGFLHPGKSAIQIISGETVIKVQCMQHQSQGFIQRMSVP